MRRGRVRAERTMRVTKQQLMAACGGAVWKTARQIVLAGRVSEASEQNGVYTAEIRGGDRPKKPKVVIKSATDISTHCGCMANRRTGALCEHGVAVVYAVIAPEEAVIPREEKKPRAKIKLPKATGPKVEIQLPQPFGDLLAKRGHVPARWRVLDAGQAGLSANLLGLDSSKSAGVMQLSPVELGMVIKMASEASGGLALDGEKALRCSSDALRWPVTLERAGDELILQSGGLEEGQRLLKVGGDVFLYDESAQRLQALASGGKEGPETLMSLIEDGSMAVDIADFLGWSDWWAEHFYCQPGLRELEVELQTEPSPHKLALSGGSRGLILHLTESEAESGVTQQSENVWLRHVANPLDAAKELTRWGFRETDHRQRKYELNGEEEVRIFLAHKLDDLKASPDWQWDISEPIAAYADMLEPLEPEFDFAESGGGEDWTGFDLGFRAPGSDRLSLDQIRKLLGAGRTAVKMRSGKTAVLAPAVVHELEEVLHDANVRQQGGNDFQADPRQLLFLREIAGGGVREQPSTADVGDALGGLALTLRPYQMEGVAFMKSMLAQVGGTLLADDMGLGKTLQSLCAVSLLDGDGVALVVCPTSLLGNWKAEAAKFFPKWKVVIYHGSGRRLDETADLVITSYALVARDLEKLREVSWKAVLLDEASLIRNAKTQAAKAVCQLESNHRLALTGTPVENSVADLWSLFRFLLPGYLGREKDFAERYEKPLRKGQADPALLSRLRKRIAPFMLRRVKKDVAKDLPEKLMIIESAGMTEMQSDMYHSLMRDGAQVVAEFTAASGGARQGARMQMLTLLLRLRQAASDPRLLGLPDKDAAGGKIERLRELVGEAIGGGHKVLVFSQFTGMLSLISEALESDGINHCLLTGSTRDRAGEVARFQKPDGPPVFLISLKAGGYGLTLTEADTVVHFDPWWNPAVEAQATDRAHRIGQTKTVNVYKFITKGTVEEKILALQEKKKAVLDAAFDEGQPLMKGLDDQEMVELLKG